MTRAGWSAQAGVAATCWFLLGTSLVGWVVLVPILAGLLIWVGAVPWGGDPLAPWVALTVLGLALQAHTERYLVRALLAPRSEAARVEAARAALLVLPLAPWWVGGSLVLVGALPRGAGPVLLVPLEAAATGTALLAAYGLVLVYRLGRPLAPRPAGPEAGV